MLLSPVLIQAVLSCVIKINLGILLNDSIPACVAHNYHCTVSIGSSLLLVITPEIASGWSGSDSRTYSG
jgi:hypothetical protein